ncbi:hypothetical protein LV75_005737 [Actinokineospora diospyrosa]|uniref:Uncharacterized protein n=1 Tax=Actinokineospora diospyrosa TaxID=103728 RepID=A0ABT1ILX8_9PSEU|nr:hypothetical protein [Actinokineospora diospyrosa]
MPTQPPPGPPQPTAPATGHSDPAVPTRLPSGPPQPTFPAPGQSESLVPNARWGGLVLRGGTTPVASPRGRAMLFGPCFAVLPRVLQGPRAKQVRPIELFALSRIGPDVAARQRGVRSGSRCRRRADPNAPNPFPRTPNHGPRQDQPDQKPPNTQPTDAHRHNGSSERRPVDSQNRCGQTNHAQPPPQDHPPQEPPVYSLPTASDKPAAANGACGLQKRLWTNNNSTHSQDQQIEPPPTPSLPRHSHNPPAATTNLWTTKTIVDTPVPPHPSNPSSSKPSSATKKGRPQQGPALNTTRSPLLWAPHHQRGLLPHRHQITPIRLVHRRGCLFCRRVSGC